MKVKEIDRTANIAWSPDSHHPIYLATGTAAQQLDATFSTSAALEIYALNLQEPGLDMGLKASLSTEHRFNKVIWGGHAMEGDSGGQSGVIVGGTDSGQLIVYSPTSLLAGTGNEVVFTSNKHTGPIYSMDFNSFQSNLLVSGGGQSEILIWDLNNPNSPLTPGAKTQPSEDVSCVSWNRQVQHILASAFPARCVVWDLRKNEPIIKVADSSAKLRCKVVDWHPEVATQLCLASEDDQCPVVQLWDLRFATSPLKSLERHTRGILSIAWCQRDPDLLLSCGKDNRILCWNPNSNVPGGEVVCELPTNNQWSFEVLWCPRNPAVIASASFDGHVSVYSLMGGQTQAQQPSSKIVEAFPGAELGMPPTPPPQLQGVKSSAMPLQKPPKWLRRPVGATFAFGGKLVTFGPSAAVQGQAQSHLVYVSQVVTEPQLMNKASKLESALNGGSLAAFCQDKIQQSSDEHDRMIWSFLQASFDASPRSSMLTLLGYNPSEIAAMVRPASKKSSRSHTPSQSGESDVSRDLAQMALNDTDTFETIAANEKKAERKLSINTDPNTSEGLVSCTLLTGNISSAVELFVQEERWADALLLAQAGGRDLLRETQRRYLESGSSNMAQLITAVVTSDWEQVVRKVDLACWKEALAAVLTYARPEEFSNLCQLLGTRLENQGSSGPEDSEMLPQAMLCFICAGSLHRLTACWTKWHHIAKQKESPELLQNLVEQIVILRQTVAEDSLSAGDKSSETLSDLLGRYASLLASQGSMASASTYLMQADSHSLLVLRDRIYQSLGLQSPHFPFQRVNVKGQQQQAVPQLQQQIQTPTQQQQQQQQQQAASFSAGRGMPRVAPSPAPAQQFQTYQPQQFQAPPSTYGQPQPPTNMYPQQPQSVPSGYMYNPSVGDMAPPPPSPSPFVPQQPMGYQGMTPLVPSEPAPPPPPPTSSAASFQGSGGHHLSQRYPKHVQDHSVYPDPMFSAGYRQAGGPGTGMYPDVPTSGPYFQPSAPVPMQQQQQQSFYSVEHQNPTQFHPQQPPPPAAAPPGPPPLAPPSDAKPGWNDPPPLKSVKRNSIGGGAGSAFEPPASTPILNPIAAPVMPTVDPAAATAGYYQGGYPQGVAPQGMAQSTYGVPMQMVAPMVNSHVQQMQGFVPPQPVSQPPQQAAQPPPPPKEKGPIPPEHQLLQDTFEDLRNQCTSVATNPQIRRKLDDVARKLEYLYDKLRENTLSANMLSGLHEVVRAVQQGAYQGALGVHSQLVSGTDFAETSSFMPGLKVLLQIAQQLGVYLQ